jgi:hypothetical protein
MIGRNIRDTSVPPRPYLDLTHAHESDESITPYESCEKIKVLVQGTSRTEKSLASHLSRYKHFEVGLAGFHNVSWLAEFADVVVFHHQQDEPTEALRYNPQIVIRSFKRGEMYDDLPNLVRDIHQGVLDKRAQVGAA